jgi:glycosyltransferase involved in cell wall biosynthesis
MAEPPLLSVIVPVYNEERYLEQVLRKVVATPYGKEILVVNDGSTDATGRILQRLSRELPIRVLTHERNRGKGRAIRTGIEASRAAILLVQDADLEYDPADYPALVQPMLEGRAEVVYGSRFLGRQPASYFLHRIGNWVITAMVNLCFGGSLTDAETCYKAFRRERIASIPLRAMGFEFEVEVTCKLLRQRVRILEVPVSYYGRTYAEGKKITWKDGMQALWVIACCRLNPGY